MKIEINIEHATEIDCALVKALSEFLHTDSIVQEIARSKESEISFESFKVIIKADNALRTEA